MAEAQRNVERKVIETETVVLTLSKEEALTLHALTGKVGGIPEGTVRVHTDAVYEALGRASVDSFKVPKYRNAFTGTLFI